MSDLENALNLGYDKKLDALAKKIIANRHFLGRILKEYVPEFRDIPYEDICDKYIEPKIYIGKVAVERDLTNPSMDEADVAMDEASDTIDGIMNEDTTVTEATVTYDVLFKVKCPGKSGKYMEFYINIEAQADYYPGYPLEIRALYYASRRFASQLRHITRKTNYGALDKVYSIWLVMGDTVPQYAAGTVSYYHMTKEDLVGAFEQDADIYDKISTIMIRFDEKTDIEDPYLKSLQTIFKKHTTKEEKRSAFESQGIVIDDQLEGGMDDMCNYGSYVATSSRKEGLKEGLKEGRKEGVNGTIEILRDMNVPERDIAEKIKAKYNLTDEEVDEYLSVLV